MKVNPADPRNINSQIPKLPINATNENLRY